MPRQRRGRSHRSRPAAATATITATAPLSPTAAYSALLSSLNVGGRDAKIFKKRKINIEQPPSDDEDEEETDAASLVSSDHEDGADGAELEELDHEDEDVNDNDAEEETDDAEPFVDDADHDAVGDAGNDDSDKDAEYDELAIDAEIDDDPIDNDITNHFLDADATTDTIDDADSNAADPFVKHFATAAELPPARLLELREGKTFTQIPSFSTIKENVFIANIPAIASHDSAESVLLPTDNNSGELTFESLHVKPKLVNQWRAHCANRFKINNAGGGSGDFAHPLLRTLFPLMSQYYDIVFPTMTVGSHSLVQHAYTLHILNHVFKARDRVTKHNARINEWKLRQSEREEREKEVLATLQKSERKKALKSKRANPAMTEPMPEYRDQGFTRCTVLILVPYANVAYQIIQAMLALLPPSMAANVDNKARFQREFAPSADTVIDDTSKSASFRHLFSGQLNDACRIGLSFNGRGVKLYSSFYGSDVIVATPLGLRMIVGDESVPASKRDYDFLSSVELCVIDCADVIAQQNFEHLTYVMELLNRLPANQRGLAAMADIGRIRPYHLNGQASYRRQTLVFAYELYHSVNSLARSSQLLHNERGLVLLRPTVLSGAIARNKQRALVKQTFHRLPCQSIQKAADDRFDYFVGSVWPKLYSQYNDSGHCLIFVSHYFDYVRLRNWLKMKHYSFAALSEYSKNSDLSRHRANFFHSRKKFLVVTERLQFFRRYRLRGSQCVVFYSLPQNSELYSDCVNQLEASSDSQSLTVLALFNRLDALALERVVGTQRASKLLTDERDTHLFA